MPIGDLLAQINGEPSPTTPNAPYLPPSKRKADGELSKPVEKVQRTGQQQASNWSRPISQPARPVIQQTRPSTVNTTMANLKLGPAGRLSKPATSFQNGQPTPPPSTESAVTKTPKKGSYAEIMARGKAAQATLGQVGKIQHKKIEKQPSKREREEMKAQQAKRIQKNISPGGKFRAAGQAAGIVGRNGEKAGLKKTAPEPEKKIKKAAVATTGYTGTARPKPGGTSGASRPSVSSSSRYGRGPDRYSNDRRGASSASKGYGYASEEEEEEEEEDQQDYDSDASSDMEAAAFEVDDEEEQAARIARREDAEALAEENKLKREKEEKRRRLAAMAKSRR